MTDKRLYPRITGSFPVKITPEFIGNAIDLSESGVGFVLNKPLLKSRAQAKIEISPEEAIETEFKVIWNKQLVTEGKFNYGVCFIRLKEKDLAALRKIVILSQIKGLLENIKDKDIKDKVYNFFMVHVKAYLDKVAELNNLLTEKKIGPGEAETGVSDLNDFIVQKGDKLEEEIDNTILTKKIKEDFRKLVNTWTNRGLLTKGALEKPRGYPGDYELLEVIYNNKPISEGIGFYYDKDFLDNDYAIGVRERKNKMKHILRQFISSCSSNKINMLNLACGSCREIRELFLDDHFTTSKELNFICLDQDELALKFSQDSLKGLPGNIRFTFLKENVLNLSTKNKNKLTDLEHKFDMVYTIGLADYLPDRVLKNLLKFSYDVLNPQGKLILAHKDIKKYKPLQPNWFCDWNFYFRDENKLIDTIKDIIAEGSSLEKDYIERGCVFFITVTKE